MMGASSPAMRYKDGKYQTPKCISMILLTEADAWSITAFEQAETVSD